MRLLSMFSTLNNITRKTEEVVLCVGVGVLAFLLIINAIARKTGFLFHFIDELAMFLVILITFLGLSYAVREASHIRMAAIYDVLPEKAQKTMILIISAVSAVVMFYLGYLSIIYVLKMRSLGQVAPTLGMPYWIGILVVPVGFFLTGVQYVVTFSRNITTSDTWVGSEKRSEYE